MTECAETIASLVLDAREAVSCRTLCLSTGYNTATCEDALQAFWQQQQANEPVIGAIYVEIEQGVVKMPSQENAAPVDKRARVIRAQTASKVDSVADKHLYGVFPVAASSSTPPEPAGVAVQLWAQERQWRNELFDKVEKRGPISTELEAFYESSVKCSEATPRVEATTAQHGEETTSMFKAMGSVRARGKVQTAAATAPPKSSFFGNQKASTSSSRRPISNSTAASRSSTFAASTSAAKAPARTQEAASKRITAESMSNVLSVDSDDDEDDDDGGAPVFIKKTAGKKRVINDDDEDKDMERSSSSHKSNSKANSSGSRSAKRKLETSPAPTSRNKSSHTESRDSPRTQDPEEIEPEPTGPIKRQQEVTKTRVNEQGYMVTERVVEEVEISLAQLQQERAERIKKLKKSRAMQQHQQAKQQHAASSSTSAPSKQKKLDFFFTRK